jgi:hypothetical protein
MTVVRESRAHRPEHVAVRSEDPADRSAVMPRQMSLCLVLLLLGLVVDPIGAANRRTDAEKNSDRARLQTNGIVVGDPKVYDDALLQQMLNDA